MTGFPLKKLGVKVELLINATWTDVTAYVQLRNDISISPFGRANESSSMEAAQVTLTLNNRSGRFTPANSSGAYYPFVQLNTQIRISVNDASVNGTAYSGYQFWGEVTEWPPTWDESGRDVYAPITASGIWRRLSQSTKRLGSPYTRYCNITIRNAWTLASYWPMEDGSGSTTFANLVTTQAAMTVTAGTPTLASVSAFPGSDAIPALNGASLQGLVSTTANPTNVIWRFNMFLPSGGDTGASGAIARMNTSGTVARVEVSLSASGGGPLVITGFNSSGTQIFTGSSTLSVWGIPLMVQVGLTQSGSNVSWSLRTILPNGTVANTSVTGSVAGTVDDVTGVNFNVASAKYKGAGAGQCVVIYGNPNIVDAAAAMSGWTGEFAGARFLRVCAEAGVPAVLNGSSTSGTTMGPQVDDTLANVLQAVEATDGGLLYETRTQFGLGYRTLATLQNQSSSLTLNYAAQQLSAPLSPVDNDALIRNDVTLTNYDGYSVRAYLATGARSIQSPPNGVGAGYERTGNVSSTSHSQVNALAEQLLNSGVVSDPRYPTVTVNLARVTTASLFSAVPSMGIGDYLTLANIPAYGGAATQKQLIWGWTMVLSAFTWTITFNTIPEAPFESGFAPGTAVTGQVPGTPTTVSQAGSVSGAQIAEDAISLFSLAQEVLTFQFGGITSTISSSAPSSPADGNLWFDSSNGYQIKRWDATGGSWVPVVFDGANILGAGTITAGLIAANAVIAGNIAAGVVTATQLAAGIVKAGIVDGTLISGAQFVAYGTTGEILVYSGTPATGNLVLSVSAMAGTDGHSNAYPAGIGIFNSSSKFTTLQASSAGNLTLGSGSSGGGGLEVATQATTPVSVNSIFYADGNSSPAYRKGPAGFNGQLSMAKTDDSSITNTTASYIPITAIWPIPAGDALATTTYRLTCWGVATYTGTAQNIGFRGYFSGTNEGAWTFPASFVTASTCWRVEYIINVLSAGAGGTAQYTLTAWLNNSSGVGASSSPQAFDTTVSNTMHVEGTFATGATTVALTCYGSIFERLGA
jgi:hypothetical protein